MGVTIEQVIMLGKLKVQGAEARLFEEKLYEHVVKELGHGERRNGIWAKAFADANGVEERAQANYIKYRVQSLKDEILIKTSMDDWLKAQSASKPPASSQDLSGREEQGTKEELSIGFRMVVALVCSSVGILIVLALLEVATK